MCEKTQNIFISCFAILFWDKKNLKKLYMVQNKQEQQQQKKTMEGCDVGRLLAIVADEVGVCA